MVDKDSEINRFDDSHKSKEQWIEEAITHYKAQRYKEALIACEQGIRLDPTYARAYHGRGLTFFRLKYYGDALKSYEQACQLDPNNAKIHGDMGELFYILGNYGKAYTSYKRAVQLNNKYESVYLARAQSLVDEAYRWQSRGYVAEAITAFKKAKLFNPSDLHVRSALARLEPKQSTQQSVRTTDIPVHQNDKPLVSVHPFNCTCVECYEF
jgi:tetratricopeptide (TPR) repeat protein